MATDNPHLVTLNIGRDIIDYADSERNTSKALCAEYNISDRQLKRYIADLRHLGLALESRRENGGFAWYCANAKEIRKAGKLYRWIELENERNLTL